MNDDSGSTRPPLVGGYTWNAQLVELEHTIREHIDWLDDAHDATEDPATLRAIHQATRRLQGALDTIQYLKSFRDRD